MQTYAFGLNDVKLYTGVNTGAGTYDQMAEVDSAQMLVTELTTKQARLEGDDCIVDVVTHITSVKFTVRFGFRDLDVLQLVTGATMAASDEFEAMTFGRDTLGEFALYGVAQGTDGDETLGVFIPRCKILENFGVTLEKGTYVTPELSGMGVYDDEEGYAMAIGNAHGLATLGAPVGGGGALPESITDDFAVDSGKWLDGNLAPAAITVSGGRGIWTPTVDATELLTNGNMETGDPPTGWESQSATLAAETTDVYAGLQSIRGTATSTAEIEVRNPVADVGAQWLIASGYLKRVTFSAWSIAIRQSAIPYAIVRGPGAGTADYEFLSIRAWGSLSGMRWSAMSGAGPAGQYSLADDASLKALDPETAWRVQRIYYPSTLSCKIRRSLYAPKGVGFLQSLDNYIGVIMEEHSFPVQQLKLIKNVEGTPTIVAAANFTYAADGVLELIPNTAFTAFTVKYGGAQIIAETALADFGATGVWYAGLINTYNSDDIDADAFDDFSAVRVAAAPPF